LAFGSDRQDLRTKLKYDLEKNKGRFDTEDSYGNSLPDNWFRLHFDHNKLSEIELLGGTVTVDSVPITIDADLKETLKRLTDKGFVFEKGDYGYSDFSNLFDIGDSEENGGEPNQIIWFYTATSFDHLKE
jgi:hypothetical protein